MDNNLVLLSLTKEEFRSLIQEAVKEELASKKEKELLSFKEMVQFLGISSSGLNNFMRNGRVPFKKLGKRVFFSRTEVISALKESNYYRLRELK